MKKGKLKKQTQYIQDLTDAKSLMKGDYGNISAHRVEENKANQSQFHTEVLTKGAGKRKKSLAKANLLTG
ncbi:hypothetical protein ACFL5F_06005 [Planctomycetota bacterium]